MVAIRRPLAGLWVGLVLALLAFGSVLHAQEDPNAHLDKLKASLDAIETQLRPDNLGEDSLTDLAAKLPPLRDEASGVADDLAPRLQQIDDALGQLGPKPESGAESPDVAADRAAQTKQRQSVDDTIRRARLLVVRADQIADTIRGRQRDLFADRILVRSRSLLEPSLWIEALAEAPRHISAIETLTTNWSAMAVANADPVRISFFVLSLVLAVVLAWPVRRLIQAWGQRFAVEQAPATRLRRSAYAFWVVVVTTAAPGLAALSVYLGLTLTRFVPEAMLPLLRAVVWMTCFVAFATGLGRALLAPGRASWRLPAISDELVQRVKPYPLWISVVAALGVVLTVFNSTIGTALASAIVANGIAAMVLAAVFVLFLRALRKGRLQAQEASRPGGDDWIAAVVRLLAWATIAIAVVAVVTGYTALALFLVRQLVWVSLVLAALYLLLVLVDDIASTFAGNGSLDQSANAAGDQPPRSDALEQLAILLSGLLRLALIVVAALLVVAPWGVRSTDALTWTRRLSEGLAGIGISIDLGTVVGAIVILVLGVALTRGIQRWLERSYLPHTRLDDGLKVSIRTGVGYAGIIIAFGLTLSALGLSLDKIAIVAGALSVGIGFGLQSIVSNFVSGLILLAERPIRAGDWVQVGTDQGNVKRISVRSTVIEMFDRSTLIVPNSDLITKPVRNWTHRNPIGRVQLNIGVGFGTDVMKVRAILTDAATSHPAVLCQPAVDVQINGTTDLGISFSLYAYVSSPRQAGNVRSDLFFTVLQRLQEESIRTTAAPS